VGEGGGLKLANFALRNIWMNPYRFPPNNSLHLVPNHYEANSTFCSVATAVVDVVLEWSVGDGVHRSEFTFSGSRSAYFLDSCHVHADIAQFTSQEPSPTRAGSFKVLTFQDPTFQSLSFIRCRFYCRKVNPFALLLSFLVDEESSIGHLTRVALPTSC